MIDKALELVERTPEHELRRLLERMAVTHPFAVVEAVERMAQFDNAVSLPPLPNIKQGLADGTITRRPPPIACHVCGKVGRHKYDCTA